MEDNERKVSWDDIGETFEIAGKIGFALTIGFSAASVFCRLAEQGKVRVPSLNGLIAEQLGSKKPKTKLPGKRPATAEESVLDEPS